MEGHVLYEAGFTVPKGLGLLAVLFFILLGLIARCAKTLKNPRGTGKRDARVGLAIGAMGILLLAGVMALVIPEQARLYRSIVGAYERGDYQIAEGFVADFHPMPKEGHDTERFTLHGTAFEYSDYSVQFGYHTSRAHGGIITGNGQHLRIGYVEDPRLGNVIVRIEELPPYLSS